MRIFITGGTGLIGQQLCQALLQDGHELTVLSRHPESVASKCGVTVQAFSSLEEWTENLHFDAVINLAGEPIVDAHWSEKRKRVLWESRVTLTENLVRRIAAARQKPTVLLSGSAIGYYGNRGDAMLGEAEPSGDDFAAQLCRAWEDAARAAENLGVRVCLLRTGLVLSGTGGLLGRMLWPFKLALGARLGDGKQWMSWIHMTDYIAMTQRLLSDANCSGAYNLTAPQPVSNQEFTQTLARAVNRPAVFVAPAMVLKLVMGERATLLLDGQRVLPKKLETTGAKFVFATLSEALCDLLSTK